jgi:aspartate racemase
MWECVLDVNSVAATDSFFDLGGDSLQALALICKIEKAFGRRLSLADLRLAPTPERMAHALRRGTGERSGAVVELKAGQGKRPLFCLPGSGGELDLLYPLAEHFDGDRPFYGLSYRSLIDLYPPGPTMEQIAIHFLEAIRAIQPVGPYAIAGYSFGGIVAFELAHQLHARGEKLELLALIDTWTSEWPKVASPVSRLGIHSKILLRLPLKSKLRYLADRVRDRAKRCLPRNWPIGPDDSLPNIIQRLERGNHRAARRYRPKPVDGRLALFRALERPVAVGVDMSDHSMGWGRLVQGSLECYEVPGDHQSMMRWPNVRVLAELLNSALGASTAR